MLLNFDYEGLTDQLDYFCFHLMKSRNLRAASLTRTNATFSDQNYVPYWFQQEIINMSKNDLQLYELARKLNTKEYENLFDLSKRVWLEFINWRESLRLIKSHKHQQT